MKNSWVKPSLPFVSECDRHQVRRSLDPNTGKAAGLDSRPEHIKEVAEASLKRRRTTSSICSISTVLTRIGAN